ncbi:MAG: phenylalanine--tRNA ligase subunit beta [Deltaproteobacteria bacterium]|nr:phenylalanine--tRNA ligase subunit beta [Deltaproteobacteria bacterium]
MALRVPLKWLAEYVEPTLSPEELAERLTVAGLEVESVESIGGDWDPETIVVGHVRSVAPHPDADRLCLVAVDYGADAPLTVVTGAPNLVRHINDPLPPEGYRVAFARAGAELIDGYSDVVRKIRLKPSKIRGVPSEGMVCSEKELGLSDSHEGIMILPGDAPVGAPLRDYLGDHVLEFDIKGSFAHLMCVYGIARETAALTGRPLDRSIMEKGSREGVSISADPSFIRLEIEDPALCPRYTALLIEGIRVGPSPFWLQQHLLRAGMRPINAVVDATNYVMLELGQPLHAFDYHKLRGVKSGEKPLIRVRRAAAGEKMKTLDDVERTFDDQMQLITDGGGPVAIAGVMGGLESEISEVTTHVLLETANFEFLNTRRTSQLLKLRTEASDRFGKRLDPGLCLDAGLRCAHLIAELCGGKVRAEYGDLYPAPRAQEQIMLDPVFITRLLGMEIPRADIIRILEALEFSVTTGSSGQGGPGGGGREVLLVTPPSHRLDISMPADLVEEVARIYGYDRMPETRMADEIPPQRRNTRLDGTERVRDILTGCGLDEIITYSIVSLEDAGRLYPGGGSPPAEEYLSLLNPLAADRAHLRRRLLPEALNTARNNLRFSRRVGIFEVGALFHPAPGEKLPRETPGLCVLLTGPRTPEHWQEGSSSGGKAEAQNGGGLYDFFDIKGVAEALLEGLEITDAAWERAPESTGGLAGAYHKGRSARLVARGRELGVLGELHPGVADSFGLPRQPVCALELDLPLLIEMWREDKQMTPLSLHPPVYEDLAFIVPADTPAQAVRDLIAQTGRPLVRQVELFDLYEGGQVGQGRKSLAFALTYQADDRTLTDNEVGKVRGKIIKRLEHELEARLRA